MPQKMIDELFSKRIRNSLGRIVSNKQDLKFEQLRIYHETAGLSLNEKFASNLELLTDSEKFYLLADNNSTSNKVAEYSGKTRVGVVAEWDEISNLGLIKDISEIVKMAECFCISPDHSE